MAERINNSHQGDARRPHRSHTISSKQFVLDHRPADDLIVALANAHENRRARQVNEWERIRQGASVST